MSQTFEGITLKELSEELLRAESIVVTAHVSPDPDAIGSSCGLALALSALGKRVVVFLSDQVPEILRSLVPPRLTIVHTVPEGSFDLFVAVDTASKKRVGERVEEVMAQATSTYNIDHHASNDRWAARNYIDSKAAASAEIIESLLREMKVSLSPEIANLLFGGLIDDTGSFRFSNTSIAAFECAARLVRAGASPLAVSNALYYSMPSRVLRLRSLALGTLRFHFDGKLALVSVSQEMLDSCGATAEDTEGLVEEVRAIGGTTGITFLRQIEGGWKLSLRSKNEALDVGRIAAVFGGGGHKAAAGCKISGTLEEAEQKVLEAWKSEFRST